MSTPSTPSFPYQRGILQTTTMSAPASTAINPGDFLYDNGSGVAYPALNYTWTSNLSTTQANYVAVGVGFSLDQRNSNDATTNGTILVCTEAGAAYFPCAALGSASDVGTFFGLAQDASSSNNLSNQLVAVCASGTLAVGKLIEYAPSGSTQVLLHTKAALPLGGLT